ncbi:MAG: TolC family protein [Bacillota bacterium]|uniref:TolC family protein n=1 Tax=Desulforudis sp. DRI-14 TaxID=3459793 RepID=UPI003BDD8D1C
MRVLMVVAAIVFTLLNGANIAFATVSVENQARKLTLQEAINRALLVSDSLRKAEVDLEDADSKRKSVTILPQYIYEWSEVGEQSIYAKESLDFNYQRALNTYYSKRDAVALEAIQRYYDVVKCQRRVDLKELTVTRAKQELMKSQALYRCGMLTRSGLMEAEAKVSAAEGEVVSARGELDKACLSLNLLLKLPVGEQIDLVDAPTYAPIQGDYKFYEGRALYDNPLLKIASEATKYKDSVQNMTPSPGTGTVINSSDVEKARLDNEIARNETLQLVRSLYNSILALESSYEAMVRDLDVARETLRTTKMRYQVGMVTSQAVLEAEVYVASAEQGLFELATQHECLKLALEKPWAYTPTPK